MTPFLPLNPVVETQAVETTTSKKTSCNKITLLTRWSRHLRLSAGASVWATPYSIIEDITSKFLLSGPIPHH